MWSNTFESFGKVDTMIIDTDVLIWYFRGYEKAKKTLNKIGRFSISAVVYMELLQGVKNKEELRYLKHFISEREIDIISLDHEITSRAIYFLERFRLSNGLQMGDALIAATVDLRGESLLSGNHAHYKMIPGLDIKKFKIN
jgi:predicted nucleic acid-binding protein